MRSEVERGWIRAGVGFSAGLLLLLAGSASRACAATVALGEASSISGQSGVALPLSLTVGTGEQVSALAFDVHFDPTLAQWQSVSLEPTVAALGKQVEMRAIAPGHVRIVLYGLDRQLLSSGAIAQCLVQVLSSAPPTTTVVTLQSGFGADPNGVEQTLLLSDGRLWIQAPPDVAPPQISAMAASSLTSAAGTITWTTDEAATSQVEYGLSTSYGTLTPLDAALLTGHSVGLGGLAPATLYHYRVRSKDAAGNEGISADATFTTAPLPVVAVPTITPAGGSFVGSVTVTLASATSGAAIRYTLDGSAPTGASTLYAAPFPLSANATVKAKAFQSGMTDSAEASAAFTVTPSGGGAVTATATQASASSPNWSTSGTDRYAWGAGEWLDYRNDFGAGGPWTLGLTATNKNSAASPGLPAGYSFLIEVSLDGAYRGTIVVPGSTTTYQTGTLPPLAMPGGLHTVRFKWTNDAWLGGVYDANIQVKGVSFIPSPVVADTTPPGILGITVANITTTSAAVTWGTDEAATSQVEYGLSTSYGTLTPLDAALLTGHSVGLGGLAPATLYHYRVRSKDAAGNEGMSVDKTFTTTQVVTTTQASVLVTSPQPYSTVTGSTVYLRYTVSGAALGSSTGYHVHIRLDGGEVWHVYNTDPFGLTNLKPGWHVVEVTLVDNVNHYQVPGANTYARVKFKKQ